MMEEIMGFWQVVKVLQLNNSFYLRAPSEPAAPLREKPSVQMVS